MSVAGRVDLHQARADSKDSEKDLASFNAGGDCFFGMTAMDVPAPCGPNWISGDVLIKKDYVMDVGQEQLGFALGRT